MRRLVFRTAPPHVALPQVALLIGVLLAAASVAVHAQLVRVPAAPGYATNPPVVDSPLQQQLLRNYRSDLQQTQRELAVQDPSGLSREQLDVTHRLNTMNAAPTPPPAAAMTPQTPFAAPGAVPFAAPGPAPLR